MAETALVVHSTTSGLVIQERIIAQALSLVIGLAFIALLSVLVPHCTLDETCSLRFVGDFLLDRNTTSFPYPFTIQNLMWLMFFSALGELSVRSRQGRAESEQMRLELLPEDDATMLRAKDLAPLYGQVRKSGGREPYFLQRLIGRIILQFQASKSISQANALLNSSLELYQHEIDLKYNMLRYLVWLIPTLGFIGTVIGIALALAQAGEVPDIQDPEAVQAWVRLITSKLGVAFYTTLLALILSAVLVFLMHIAQAREEMALNRSGQYCLDNLINRLYEE